MKTISLSSRQRGYIATAFSAPATGPQGQPMGSDIKELRKSLRVMDDLKLDDVEDTLNKDLPNDDFVEYKMEDAPFAAMRSTFKSAQIWQRAPSITRDLVRLADKISEADTQKGHPKKGEKTEKVLPLDTK